ncbi:alpha/beta hydrolase [Nakamurella deserti]|uniref:alpha/beta hydrolase n=1 Tax=Nakamurella deserti TaxID=2164074 RepID=UPI000DBE68BA|nr:alpha/beta hydrolase-fold protein [Nakamurella deserti]
MGLSIISGWFPVLFLVLGILALVALLVDRGRSWWLRRVPIAVLAAAAVTAVAVWFTDGVWHPFADDLPPTAVVWIGLTLVALALAVVRRGRAWVRVLAFVGVLVVGLAGAVQVNRSFGDYPTLAALLGEPLADQVDASDVLGTGTSAVSQSGDAPLTSVWTAPSGLADKGRVTTSPIPGTVSGFQAQDAWIYLPPAYAATPRPLLPVLILLAGQPGTPRNWFDGPNLAGTMDAYAAAHQGIAPVVVVADWLGEDANANPLCVDSAAGGNDFTYLSKDVPDWIRANLQVDPRPDRWAVGGLSAGATCALQLATNAPDEFPTFLFFSGQLEPTLSDRADTVNTLFNGDEDAFRKINPADIMKTRTFPNTAGMFAAGASDTEYGPSTKTMSEAAKAAGMQVQYQTVPGAHDFITWGECLAASMDWLGTRLDITG